MFGKYIRAIALVPVTVVLAAFLKFVLGMIIEFMNPPEGNKLGQLFIATQQNFMMIALLSILIFLIAGALRERGTVPR